MAGTSSQFNADTFREGIRFAMELGAPPDSAQQATFYFPNELVYVGESDDNDIPFDPDIPVTTSVPDPVQVPCAIQYFDDQGELTPFGTVTPARVEVTLLDEDYDEVAGASYVVIGGDKYVFRRVEPPSGLFDAGIYVMHFAAESES